MAIQDICGPRWEILVRGGWHLLEAHGGTVFRWAQSNAECLLFTFEAGRQRVSFDLEPGPGFSTQPFRLIVFDENGERKLSEEFAGRKTVSLTVTATGPTVHVLRLHVPHGGTVVPGEVRVLDFRVFGIQLEREPEDVVATASGCRVGEGWYPIEHWHGERFRWADNDACIVVDSAAASSLELEVEPGPGLAGEALNLSVRDAGGGSCGSHRLTGRERITVPLPVERERPFDVILHCAGGGNATPGETRILNFRAFCGAP